VAPDEQPARPAQAYDPEVEAREVARARAERERKLSPAERIERLGQLCASLAASAPSGQ